MEITDFKQGSLWMITPPAMDVMFDALPAAITAENINMAGIKVRDESAYVPELTVKNNVAVVPVSGIISKRMGLYSYLFGGASIDRIRKDLFAAAEDRRIKGIVPYFDTQGGTIAGLNELADDIAQVSKVKPVVAYSDGGVLSAGYYLAAPAWQIVLSPLAEAGSIGVLTVHFDWSEQEKEMGLKRTYLYAGKFKAIGNSAEPLSDEAKQIIEGRLKDAYDVFVGSVSNHRRISEDQVRSEMADGRIFIGKKAVDAGLADRLGSLDDAIALAAGKPVKIFNNNLQAKKEKTMPEPITTIKDLRAAFPDLCDQIDAAAVSGVDLDAPRSEATTAESERILGLVNVHFGEDAGKKFAAIAANGISVDQYKAMKDALEPDAAAPETPAGDADTGFKEKMLNKLEKTGAEDPGSGGPAEGPKTFPDAVAVIMDEKKCSKAKAMGAAVALYPELHRQYIADANTRKKPAAV